MEIQFHINLNGPRWLRQWSRRRKLIVSLALTLLLIPGLMVVANHLPFTDVPTSGALHDAVGAIYGAGITAGTTVTTYSPDNPVTRGQMAFFMHRGFPRVGYNAGAFVTLDGTFQDAAVVTINTGGVAGQTGFIKLDASILAYTSSTTGCPCDVRYQIFQDGGSNSAEFGSTVYNNQASVDGNVGGAAVWTLAVPTATTRTFRLKMKRASGSATVNGAGALTALYVPFGSSGSNALAAQPDEN